MAFRFDRPDIERTRRVVGPAFPFARVVAPGRVLSEYELMRFVRLVFMVAGICGIVILVPPYFLEESMGRDHPPPISHPEFYYGFLGCALAWQLLFFVIAYDPVRCRLAMLPAVLEKASFAVAILILAALGRVSGSVIGFATLDATWMVLFAVAFLRTPKGRA